MVHLVVSVLMSRSRPGLISGFQLLKIKNPFSVAKTINLELEVPETSHHWFLRDLAFPRVPFSLRDLFQVV